MNALKPIMHLQVSMLRMWANNIERFALNYEKGWKKPRPLLRNSQATNAPHKFANDWAKPLWIFHARFARKQALDLRRRP